MLFKDVHKLCKFCNYRALDSPLRDNYIVKISNFKV